MVYLPIAKDLSLLKNGAAPILQIVYLPIARDLRLLKNGAAPTTDGIYMSPNPTPAKPLYPTNTAPRLYTSNCS